jgi:RimJ/RimL family protein N-acetyltransferase
MENGCIPDATTAATAAADARLPTLAASRVKLRWLTEQDVPALFAIFSDPAVVRYWSHGPFAGVADADALLADIHRLAGEGTLYQWGIALSATDTVIGTCTLASIDRRHRRAEVGFALSAGAWGHGYATEAMVRLIEHAFGTLDLHRLEADVDPRNAASLRLLERLGFVREGYLRERYHVNGEVQDSVLLGLLR